MVEREKAIDKQRDRLEGNWVRNLHETNESKQNDVSYAALEEIIHTVYTGND